MSITAVAVCSADAEVIANLFVVAVVGALSIAVALLIVAVSEAIAVDSKVVDYMMAAATVADVA